jgi:hypothetical protein
MRVQSGVLVEASARPDDSKRTGKLQRSHSDHNTNKCHIAFYCNASVNISMLQNTLTAAPVAGEPAFHPVK